MPPAFGESTEVVAPGKVGVTIGGGGGGVACSTCSSTLGLGAFARVRVGIGGRQELGVSGFGVLTSGSSGGVGAIGGGALSYKLGAAPWLAFVANAGAIDQSFGGDVALIVAPYTDSGGRQIYTGLRGSVAIPLVPDVRAATTAVTAPIGLSLRPTSASRVFLEAGVMAGGQQTDGFDAQRVGGVGGYASIAVEILSR